MTVPVKQRRGSTVVRPVGPLGGRIPAIRGGTRRRAGGLREHRARRYRRRPASGAIERGSSGIADRDERTREPAQQRDPRFARRSARQVRRNGRGAFRNDPGGQTLPYGRRPGARDGRLHRRDRRPFPTERRFRPAAAGPGCRR